MCTQEVRLDQYEPHQGTLVDTSQRITYGSYRSAPRAAHWSGYPGFCYRHWKVSNNRIPSSIKKVEAGTEFGNGLFNKEAAGLDGGEGRI